MREFHERRQGDLRFGRPHDQSVGPAEHALAYLVHPAGQPGQQGVRLPVQRHRRPAGQPQRPSL